VQDSTVIIDSLITVMVDTDEGIKSGMSYVTYGGKYVFSEM